MAREFHERITYLERIIKHYAPGLDLRTENLRQKARDLAPEDFDPAEDVSGSPSIDSNADVTIQDESCTINAVNDIIARLLPEFRTLDMILTIFQIIRGSFPTGISLCASTRK